MRVSGKSNGIVDTAHGVLSGRTIVWSARLVWLAVAVLGGAPFGDALAAHSRPVQVVATIALWMGWGSVALALLVPSTVALTAVRAIVPLALVCAGLAATGSSSVVEATVALALCFVMVVLTASGEVGQMFVQASAYGDERRFLLRPPVGFIVPLVVSWSVAAACSIVGPLALAARGWVPGVVLSLGAAGAWWFLAPRFHRLSRRWLVLVPAGVVLHDHVVLADTVMVATRNIAGLQLAYADTEAADLTGPAAGHAVELAFGNLETVVLAPTRQTPGGRALHVRSVLVAPTRPGRLLAAARSRNLPVGWVAER